MTTLLALLAAVAAPAPTPLAVASLTSGSGKAPAMMESDPSLPTHTLYRPIDLKKAGKLPILVWGNGGCSNLGNSARNFLTEIASHGILVIATGTIGELPRPKPSRTTSDPAPGDANGVWSPKVATPAMIQAIDWAIAQNSSATSKYRKRIDTVHVAVAGHSCGGLLALDASADPRVTTTIVMNSGALNDGRKPEGIDATKDGLRRVHGPILYVTGGKADVAFPNATDDVARIHHVPVFHLDRNVGHSGTYARTNGGAYGQVASAWLAWRLKGDRAAAAEFLDDGLVRRDPEWHLDAHY
ncbi:alpha/beta hydrolase [Sphingobium sp. KCTC 72723]|uniref:alpha/beta hydrolase n=1 Tax=Sphingobium sp. KCTC 72723 TaxID=2733867 RepID=UPI00165D9C63|nr:alpha/beta hydrolase [Sphingobium sp. KCTC 72723]